MALDMTVFDVERGLSVVLKTPNNYGILIDCGSSDTFSPVLELQWNTRYTFTPWGDSPLAYFIVTHPHSDHLSDIEQLHNNLKPSIIRRRKDLNWERVRNSNFNNAVLSFYKYHFFPPHDYTVNVPPEKMPPWGDEMEITQYQLDIKDIEDVSKNDSAYVNNSSIVVLVKYKGYSFAITGDMEKEGMKRLLEKKPSLCSLLKHGIHFLVCPHHGHTSGFCQEWFDITGPTRIFNIVSERRKSPNEAEEQTAIDSRYSSVLYSLADNNEGKRMISTKSHGHIDITINDNSKWSWNSSKTPSLLSYLLSHASS